MKRHSIKTFRTTITILFIFLFTINANPCSTFKLQKGEKLVYGHNLNEGDIGVPGLVFINKRGIFKTGRTWSEIITKDKQNPSSHCWISMYGSVTFNNFGKDFPDGGMNEEGLFIWEMNEDAQYPTNTDLPKLNQMNWMQYILDNYMTVEEAIRCASEIEIDGWGWHFFVGDAKGNTAAIAFVDGKPLVRTGKEMPVPGLFNSPYDREMELLKYFRGFGGLYEPILSDPEVPRFVKTAVMIKDYSTSQDIVEYGLKMLDSLKVNDVPEWSVLYDPIEGNIYFKTRLNPSVKTISINNINFSNQKTTLILNMDENIGGDVLDRFEAYTPEKFEYFTKTYFLPIIPKEFCTYGGITIEEYLFRISNHSNDAKKENRQFFKGIWNNNSKDDKLNIKLNLKAHEDAVIGQISIIGEITKVSDIEHIHLIGNELNFTFKLKEKIFIEAKAVINKNEMDLELAGTEDYIGAFKLMK